jgi:FkbM family methyltransferase
VIVRFFKKVVNSSLGVVGLRLQRVRENTRSNQSKILYVPESLRSLKPITAFDAQSDEWGFKTTIIWKQLFDVANLNITEHSHFIDLGAHIGLFSALCCQNGLSGVAVEASPENFRLLVKNLRAKNVHLISGAVVPDEVSNDEVTFCFGSRSTNGFVAQVDSKESASCAKIPAIKIDRILKIVNEFQVQKLLVKIDIEGAEWGLMDNIKKLCLLYQNITLLVEVHENKENNFDDFTRFLSDLGMTVTALRRGQTMDLLAYSADHAKKV